MARIFKTGLSVVTGGNARTVIDQQQQVTKRSYGSNSQSVLNTGLSDGSKQQAAVAVHSQPESGQSGGEPDPDFDGDIIDTVSHCGSFRDAMRAVRSLPMPERWAVWDYFKNTSAEYGLSDYMLVSLNMGVSDEPSYHDLVALLGRCVYGHKAALASILSPGSGLPPKRATAESSVVYLEVGASTGKHLYMVNKVWEGWGVPSLTVAVDLDPPFPGLVKYLHHQTPLLKWTTTSKGPAKGTAVSFSLSKEAFNTTRNALIYLTEDVELPIAWSTAAEVLAGRQADIVFLDAYHGHAREPLVNQVSVDECGR